MALVGQEGGGGKWGVLHLAYIYIGFQKCQCHMAMLLEYPCVPFLDLRVDNVAYHYSFSPSCCVTKGIRQNS